MFLKIEKIRQKLISITKLPRMVYLENLKKVKLDECYNECVDCVGVDPGRRNVLTMVSDCGEKLVYSSRQRYHKSGLKRYAILEKEKRKNDILKIEELSKRRWILMIT